jgi:hypothetical protein
MKPDNNIDRVVHRARQSNAILYWQCVNYDGTADKRLTYVDDADLPAFERQNNVGMRWLITPVLNLAIVDFNGNAKP